MGADSMFAMEPLRHVIGDMPKNIMKSDYFVDINPRSMRRLMNIIAMAGKSSPEADNFCLYLQLIYQFVLHLIRCE